MWCKLLHHKYLKSHAICDSELKNCTNSSSIWKGIEYGAKLLRRGSHWRVGMGDRIKFWIDLWVPDVGMLKDHAISVIPADELH